jgi:nucleotide-binding universal stress UspA family protein
MAAALSEILNGIGRGAQDWERWGEIADFLERRRRLVESEQKRRIAMHLVVKVEQAVDAMNQIADAVRDAVLEHVDDGAVRRLVLSDVQSSLDRYLAGSVPRQVDGGD